jgi:glutathione S-transferase
MIKVHHLNNSRSQRILWMLEELRVAYEVVRYERNPKTMLAPAALKAVHPLGKSPVIEDNGRIIAESGAIIDYLGQMYGQGSLWPDAESPAYRQVSYWLHYAEGSLMPPLLLKLVFDTVRKRPMPFFAKPVARRICDEVTRQFVGPQIETHLGFVESQLERREWLVGERLSAADIQMSFPLEAAMARGTEQGHHPNIAAYVARFQARPAYRRALEVGGPYDYA